MTRGLGCRVSVYVGWEEHSPDIRGILFQSTTEIGALLSLVIPLLPVQIRQTWQENLRHKSVGGMKKVLELSRTLYSL